MDGQGLLTGEYVQHIQRPQFYSDKAHLFDAQ
jgi:pilus assembly protein CpaF